MGMAASQARLLTLQARQSDLEYQGQQINQERSVLSQQVTALYNSLLTMSVPTPPSTTDYTTVQYSGTIGATAYRFDASSVKPCKKDGDQQTYYVTVKQSAYGDSLNKNPNISVVNNSVAGHVTCLVENSQVQKTDPSGNKLYYTTVEEPVKDASGNPLYYVVGEDGEPTDATTTTQTAFPVKQSVRKEVTTETTEPVMVGKQYTSTDIASFYVKNTDGTITKAKLDAHFEKTTDGKYYTIKDAYKNDLLSVTNGVGQTYKVKGAVDSTTVDGHPVFTKDAFKTEYSLTDEQMQSYEAAVTNSGLIKPNGDPYTIDEFYMYFNDDDEACFALISDVDDNNDNTVTYTYIANGDYSKSTTYADSKLTFDPTSGRITSISIPNGYDNAGNVTSYSTMEVAAASISDDMAYEDAYNKYEYEKYQYDKKQQEINAQTEIIQQMDRNLELKLQRLDNEREQITNEVEALDKVISENIQGSYKTFSG